MTETEGDEFEKTNEYRASFFKDVTEHARKVGSMDILSPCEDDLCILNLRFPPVSYLLPILDGPLGLTR
jgi:hypothetical protein